jgi:hypothetical protein
MTSDEKITKNCNYIFKSELSVYYGPLIYFLIDEKVSFFLLILPKSQSKSVHILNIRSNKSLHITTSSLAHPK